MFKFLALLFLVSSSVFGVFGQSDTTIITKTRKRNSPFGSSKPLNFDSIKGLPVVNERIFGTWVFSKMKLYKNGKISQPTEYDYPYREIIFNKDHSATFIKFFDSTKLFYVWILSKDQQYLNYSYILYGGKYVDDIFLQIEINKLSKRKLIVTFKNMNRDIKSVTVYKKKKVFSRI